MFFLANQGCRVVAHDRRGHGRSDQPWDGNNMDTWADDLYQLIEHLDLRDIMLVGHSTGGGEITRLCARHGTSRVKKLVLVSALTPLMIKTPDTPHGVPLEAHQALRDAIVKDRSATFYEVPKGPFFGYNRPGVTASQGLIDSWWAQGMQASFKSTYDTIKSWETDFREEMKELDIPVLVIHGDDDQIVPFKVGQHAIEFLKKGTFKAYPGGAHALPNTEADGINKDLWDFLNA